MSWMRGALSMLWLVAASCADDAARSSPPVRKQPDIDAGQAHAAPAADGGKRSGAPPEKDAAPPPPPKNRADPRVSAKPAEPAQPQDDDAGAPKLSSAEQEALLAALGEKLFNDRSLSVTRTQACATCHVVDDAFTGSADHDNPRAPVSKGATGKLLGTRNAQTAMYADFAPAFAFVRSNDAYVPKGGLFWDGRASSLSEQAAAPFLNPREMALPDKAAVIDRVQKGAYVAMFEPLFGASALANVEQAYQRVTDAIAAFERTERFHPFASKFDGSLRGTAQLSEQEQQGFALFKDPQKGNCISCHAGQPDSHEPQDWLFSDFSYASLGVPRNTKIVDTADERYFDLGLCQSATLMAQIPADVADKAAFVAGLCGAFKVPTLRNVARTAPYMHNGYFAELRDAVDFHVTRDSDATRWFPDGKLNDLPEQYWPNVTPITASLSSDELDAVVAFLQTLSDPYP